MKGLVLSGGKGTRLRPITHTSAKQLVPVANKPILFYGLEAIAKSDIKEVGIVVGDTKNEIKSAVGDGSKFGLKVTYIEQEAPLGLAHAVKISQSFLKDDEFVMYLGDNLIRDGIKTFVDKFKEKKPNSQILLAKVTNPQHFGVAELEDGRIINLVEKPKQPKSDLALVGVYMFDKNIFEAVNVIKPSLRGELEITDAIQYLVDKKYNVLPHIITGWWKDTGKLEDMLEANCIILNSYIGPFTSVYFNTVIENSEIEHSIVLENSKIKEVKRIEDSLIGQNVEILKSEKKPHAYRIMVGDSSRIEIA